MIYTQTPIAGLPEPVATVELDLNFERLADQLQSVTQVVTRLIDASVGAVTVYLPNGTATPQVKDYYWQKVDSSANAVTVTPYGTQTINGSATQSLAAQYDRIRVTWSPATQEWVIV